ncbi:cysteine desulfurase NifS [Candidatus Woesearchaeota archaeon]|nr:cysteine desulfurase NifS [Candidatus Woesearchaeota archaeon]MBL7050948.1 cysteine desulfurase NifS [Candidatus Woesearchaeota archaeon]
MKVYVDNGASTKVDGKVLKAMEPYFTEKYGNASSLHDFGRDALEGLEKARTIIAKKINASAGEIIFTSGGTESDNMAVIGAAYANKNKNHIITSAIEHPAILNTCQELEKRGFDVTYLSVDEGGFVDPKDVESAITDKTALVTIMHANNETGVIEPIEEIGKICREKGVLFHTDTVQSFTKVDINVKKMNIDMASFSSHKIHGPKGVGALYVRTGVKIKKLMYGGKHEFNLRPGTENVAGAIGFAEAVKQMKDSNVKHVTELRDKLIEGVFDSIERVKLNGPRENRLCNNVNFSYLGLEGETISTYLSMKGVATSTGSACASASLEPSHVLIAMGMKHEDAHGSIRMTLSKFTTEEEIEYILKVLPDIIKKSRRISPL